MNMIMVETVGAIMLISPRGENVRFNRPTVIFNDTNFVSAQIHCKQLKAFYELPDEATDVEWDEWLKAADNNVELALASYLSKYDGSAEKPEEPKPPAPPAATPPKKG